MGTATEEIKHSLIHKILIGQYPVGATLPSCRDLAAQLGINRNTASKVYQELAREGLVQAVRGKGVVVIRQRGSALMPVPGVRDRLLAAAREAKLLGMARDAFLQAALEVANSLFQPQRPAIAFVECNEADAESLARQIEGELSYPVQPVLLSTLEQSPEALAAGYDLVCTTLYHLLSVTTALGPARDKLVAVHAPPNPDALLEIARLDPEAQVGIVCAQVTTQQYLASAVGMVHRGNVQTCLVGDEQALREMSCTADVVVDVPSCHKQVAALLPSLPTVTVDFRIDGQSLAPLRERLARLLSDDAGAV